MSLFGSSSRIRRIFFRSPTELVKMAQSLRRDEVIGKRNALRIFDDMERGREGSFHGDYRRCLDRFAACSFGHYDSLLSGVMNEIDGGAFSVIKWRFQLRQEEGDMVDVERYLDGEDRHWNGCRRVRRTRPTVRIYVNFGGNADKSGDELAVQGAVGVTLAEAAEAAGLSAEIWGVHTTRGIDLNGDEDHLSLVCLKRQNDYADIGLIGFVLGDETFFRNIMFRLDICDVVRRGSDIDAYLGRAANATLENIGLTEAECATALVVPSFIRKDEGERWLRGKLFEVVRPKDEEADREQEVDRES